MDHTTRLEVFGPLNHTGRHGLVDSGFRRNDRYGEGGEGREMDEAYHDAFKWLGGSVATAIPKPR